MMSWWIISIATAIGPLLLLLIAIDTWAQVNE